MAEHELSVVQVNTEGCRQKDSLLQYLLRSQADAIILQEVFPHQVFYLADALQMQWAVLPMMHFAHPKVHKRIEEEGPFSVGILAKPQIVEVHQDYYPDHPECIPVYDGTWVDPAYGVLSVGLDIGGEMVTVAGTHYPVSLNGLPDERQREYLEPMYSIVEKRNIDLFCGDFNAPDKFEIGQELLQKYPAVPFPENTVTTLTPLHRAAERLPPDFRIDYMFLPNNRLSHGEMQMNYTVSDHAALFCTFYLKRH